MLNCISTGDSQDFLAGGYQSITQYIYLSYLLLLYFKCILFILCLYFSIFSFTYVVFIYCSFIITIFVFICCIIVCILPGVTLINIYFSLSHMTMRGHLETFWAMFNLVTLLVNFDFLSTFCLKLTKIWLDMTIRRHLEPFGAMFNQVLLLAISTFGWPFGWNGTKYDMTRLLRAIWSDVQSGFSSGTFHQLFG